MDLNNLHWMHQLRDIGPDELARMMDPVDESVSFEGKKNVPNI